MTKQEALAELEEMKRKLNTINGLLSTGRGSLRLLHEKQATLDRINYLKNIIRGE